MSKPYAYIESQIIEYGDDSFIDVGIVFDYTKAEPMNGVAEDFEVIEVLRDGQKMPMTDELKKIAEDLVADKLAEIKYERNK